MKSWVWRRVIIIILMIALPLAGFTATLMSAVMARGQVMPQPTDHVTRITALSIPGAVAGPTGSKQFAVSQGQATCPLPCQLDAATSCDMAHGATSCFVALAPSSSLAVPAGFSLAHVVPNELDPASYVPPLLDRPPARFLFLC